MRLPVYLDYLATTPVDPRVAARMSGVPDSSTAISAIRPRARTSTAGAPRRRWSRRGARWPTWWTPIRARSSGPRARPRPTTWRIKGVAALPPAQAAGTSSPRRSSTRPCSTRCRQLESEGFEVSYLAPDAGGIVEPGRWRRCLREDTMLVSVMHVNNELGTINDIAALGALCRERGVAVPRRRGAERGQDPDRPRGAAGRPDVALGAQDVRAQGHRRAVRAPPAAGLAGRRRCTAAGTSAACAPARWPRTRSSAWARRRVLARAEMQAEDARIAALRDRLWARLADLGGVAQNGDPARRVAGALNVVSPASRARSLIMAMKTSRCPRARPARPPASNLPTFCAP